MATSTATLHPTARTLPSAQPPLMPVGQALAQVSALVAELDPDDGAWRIAGPHVTAVVSAVRYAVDGSGPPIADGEEVAPILRLRDLARTAQRAIRAPDALVRTEEVAEHLAAVVAASSR